MVVVPADREIVEIEGQPGYFKISGGMLKELYEDQRLLLLKLEQTELQLKKCEGKK